ncbi:PAS domain S-box protein [Methylomonas sp. HYX-M1]|uniref:PAS domain S-box protein n=1 Tax=Methylomonas sp. HYX-M1 TaxID=3139307 RepID=UPI00345C1530
MTAAPSKPQIRLLLVEDDQIDRMACRRALAQHQDCEFVLFEAETGNEGLNYARNESIDCILLDYHLPDISGVDFLAELAEDTGDLPMPVVMLTGSDNAMIAVDALKSGARDYVVKGAGPDGDALQWLPAVVMRALREQRAIREKVEASELLREAEAKYRCLVEQMPAITYIASLEQPGKLLYVSPQIRQLGYRAEEWLAEADGILKWVHNDDRQATIEAFSATYESHTPLHCEYRVLTRDGRTRWLLDEANVVRPENRGALYLQGLLIDITTEKENEQELFYYRRRLEELVAQRTEQLEKQSAILESANARMDHELCERKRAEAALRNSEARFRLLLESVGDGIIGVDADGICTFVNKAALNLLGLAPEQLLDQHVWRAIQPELSPAQPQSCAHEALHNGQTAKEILALRRPDGTSISVECTAQPMQPDGKTVGAVLVFRSVE